MLFSPSSPPPLSFDYFGNVRSFVFYTHLTSLLSSVPQTQRGKTGRGQGGGEAAAPGTQRQRGEQGWRQGRAPAPLGEAGAGKRSWAGEGEERLPLRTFSPHGRGCSAPRCRAAAGLPALLFHSFLLSFGRQPLVKSQPLNPCLASPSTMERSSLNRTVKLAE